MTTITQYYHVPVWMNDLISKLVASRIARVWTNAVKEGDRYSFSIDRGNDTAYSRERSVVVWEQEFEHVRDLVYSELEGIESAELIRWVEDFAKERGDKEALSVHKCLVQLVLAKAVQIAMSEKPDQTVVINGNLDLVGRFAPGAKVEIHGNVDTIEGETAEFLKVVGGVKRLGCGPFWSVSPMTGQPGKLEVHGDLDGYKSRIANPNLDIEIFGSLKSSYFEGKFKTMTIHGNVDTTSAFPGLFEGTVIIHGTADGLEAEIRHSWKSTSAGTYGKGNIIYRGHQLVKNGEPTIKGVQPQNFARGPRPK